MGKEYSYGLAIGSTIGSGRMGNSMEKEFTRQLMEARKANGKMGRE